MHAWAAFAVGYLKVVLTKNPMADMDDADAANGEPGASEAPAHERTGSDKPATGADQAAENRENEPPA